ncbi:porin [Lysobacter daejeonensis GH1-9]|uniref:Porin n=1 Tax=Lysobacter daejeonensis GH1-9 TaxID=1385517 RepID=A0A0A0F1B4_9GAMM|nr:OprO/OprP family phosphate-selective porin [Lysobacter daejeonensis]KGM56108.1 porin [Lysobacter daejeonensis GH1-9]
MKLSRNTLAIAMLAALAAPAAHAEIAIDVIGGSEVSFEGLVQADYNDFSSDVANLNGDGHDGSDSDNELRRAELILKGKGPGNFEWVLGYDAKADKYLDANIKYKIGGNGNHYLQVGQYKQPNSMEELSSTKNNDFIAKASITNTFAVARRTGVAYGLGDSNWGVTASYFGRELTRNLAHGSGYGLRGTWAPISEKGNVLHLGLSYADYDTDADTLRLRARPMADLASVRLVDTGTMTDTDRVSTTGFEALWIRGPFKLQGEYMKSDVQRYRAGSSDFSGTGGYITGVWNVTGETWGYKGGVPTTSGPSDTAKGMWQVGLRYDTIDLDDGNVLGGQMDSVTAGVNYYWRSNFKFMLNYVKVDSERRNVEDNPSITEARVQFFW